MKEPRYVYILAEIVASDHIFYNGNCETLVVPTHDGEMGILPTMRPILAVQEGGLRFRVPQKHSGGSHCGTWDVQVANNRVTMLVIRREAGRY